MHGSTLLCLVLFFGGVLSDLNCKAPWQTFRICMKNKYNEFSSQKRLDEGSRIALENRIRTCYKSQSCFDPFPKSEEMRVRQDCYRQTRDLVKKQMLPCVKGQFSDFDWPEEDDVLYAWHQNEAYINKAEALDSKICPPSVSKLDVRSCTRDEIAKTFYNNPPKKVCDCRWECIKQQNMDKTCFERWEEVTQTLCKCTDQLQKEAIKNAYATCLSKRKYQVSDADYFNSWVDSTANRFCSGRLDALCSGFSDKDVNKILGVLGKNSSAGNLINSLLGKSGTGSAAGAATSGSKGGLSGLESLLKGGSGSGGSSSNQLSQVLNLFGAGTNKFGSLLGGGGPSSDFLSGRRKK